MFDICPPALIYIVFSLTQIIIDMFQGMFNTAFMKLIVATMITILLDALCKATEHKKQSIFLCFLGIIIESDGEVFQEVHHISWLLNGKF